MRSALVGTTQPASASFRGLPLLPAAYPHSRVLSEIRRRATVVGILPESKIGRVGGWTTPLRVVGPAYLPPFALRLLQALHRSSGSSQFQVRSLLGRVSFSLLEVIRTGADERVRGPGCVSGTTKTRKEERKDLEDIEKNAILPLPLCPASDGGTGHRACDRIHINETQETLLENGLRGEQISKSRGVSIECYLRVSPKCSESPSDLPRVTGGDSVLTSS